MSFTSATTLRSSRLLLLLPALACALPVHGSGKGQPGKTAQAVPERKASQPAVFDLASIPGIQIGPMGTGKTTDAPAAGRLQEGSTDAKAAAPQRKIRRPVVPGKYTQGVDPFFLVRSTDEVGLMTFWEPGHPDAAAQPRTLTCRADGTLSWISGDSNPIWVLSPIHGLHRIPINPNKRLHALLVDSEDELHYLGDQTIGTLTWRLGTGTDGVELEFSMARRPWAGLRTAIAGVAGDLWCSSGNEVHHLDFRTNKMDGIKNDTLATAAAMAFHPETGALFMVNPGQDHVTLWKRGGNHLIRALETKSSPQGIVLGPDGRLWITLEGRDELVILEARTGRLESVKLRRDSDKGPLGPHGIAVGPDGNLWVTLKAAGRIARVTPKGVVDKYFDLPFPGRPLNIIPSHDGRMLFTLENRPGFGAITAKPQVIPDYLGTGGDGKAEASLAGGTGQKAARTSRKLTRAERNRLHDEYIKRVEARELARPGSSAGTTEPEEAEAEVPETGATSPAQADGKEEQKAQRPEAATATPSLSALERLARVRVFLTPNRARHIHLNHGYGKDPERSQFAQARSTREQITALLAQGMEAAHRNGLIGRITDADGGYLTYCDLGETIGWSHHYGDFSPTRWVKVVTARYRNLDEEVDEHYVISAYPVAEPR
jgi:hypothetical protein